MCPLPRPCRASCLHHPLTIGLTGLGCDGAIGDRLAHDVRSRDRPVRRIPSAAIDYQISPSLAGLSVTVFSLTYMVSAPLLVMSQIASGVAGR
jgi:hypothetical protein